MAWNEFSPAEESQVAKSACQDNAKLFSSPMLPAELSTASLFLQAPIVNRHYYLGGMERLYAHAPCQKPAVPKQHAWQRARQLHVECEAVSCFQIDPCDPAPPPNSPDLAPADFYSLTEGETGPKSDISDIQCGVAELVKGSAGLPSRFRGLVSTIPALCGVGWQLHRKSVIKTSKYIPFFAINAVSLFSGHSVYVYCLYCARMPRMWQTIRNHSRR